MRDRFKDKFDEILASIRKELESTAKRIDEYLSRGDIYRAYKVWRDSVLNAMKALRKALDGISEELKEAKLSEEELHDLANYLKDGIKEVIDKIEEIGGRIKEFSGRRYVWIWFGPEPFKHAFHEFVGGVGITINGILEGVERFIKSLEKTFDDVGKKVTQVVSVRMREKDLEVVDKLVEAGIFRSRSEAIAFFARKGIEASKEWIEKALEQVKKIKELQDSIRKELGWEEDEEKD